MADRDDAAKELFASIDITAIAEFAAATREMFEACVNAGFTEDQSLTFCAKWASEISRGAA